MCIVFIIALLFLLGVGGGFGYFYIRKLKEELGTVNDLNDEITRKTSRINNLNNEIAQKEVQINNLLGEIGDEGKGLTKQKNDLDNQISDLNNRINNLNGQIGDKNSGLTKRLNDLNGEINRKTGQENSLTREVEQLKNQKNTLNNEIDRNNNIIDARKKTISDNKREIEQLKSHFKELVGKINSAKSELKNLKIKIKGLRCQFARLCEGKDVIDKDVSKKIEDFSLEKRQLIANIKELENEINNKKLELGKLDGRVLENKDKLNRILKRDFSEKFKEINDKPEKLKGRLEFLKNAYSSLVTKKNKGQELNCEDMLLKNDIEEAFNSVDTFHSEFVKRGGEGMFLGKLAY